MVSKLLIPEWSVTQKGISSASFLMRLYKLTDHTAGQVGFVPSMQDAIEVRRQWTEKRKEIVVDIEPVYLPVDLDTPESTVH